MSDVNAMVERAARVLCARYAQEYQFPDWDELRPLDRELFIDEARAAILAALDPEDEALVEAVARGMCAELGLHADDWMENLHGAKVKVWRREAECARQAIASLKALAQGESAGRDA